MFLSLGFKNSMNFLFKGNLDTHIMWPRWDEEWTQWNVYVSLQSYETSKLVQSRMNFWMWKSLIWFTWTLLLQFVLHNCLIQSVSRSWLRTDKHLFRSSFSSANPLFSSILCCSRFVSRLEFTQHSIAHESLDYQSNIFWISLKRLLNLGFWMTLDSLQMTFGFFIVYR